MALQRGLGKGLSALFDEQTASSGGTCDIDIYKISPNPNQPRHYFSDEALSDLAESIRTNGVITPIVLRQNTEGYEIIAGERRWRAARQAGLTSIPAVILDVDEKKAYELAMIENLQREDLSSIEEARGYKTLVDQFQMTQEQVAKAVAKSRPAVTNSLRLLELPASVINKIEIGQISAGHGRTILGLHTEKQMEKAAEEIILGSLSVHATENLVKRMLQNAGQETKQKLTKNLEKIYIEQLERKMTTNMGRKISITNGKKKGKLYIEFYGNEDLEQLIAQISKLKQ